MVNHRVAGLFDNRTQAEDAIHALHQIHISDEAISLTMRDREELRQLRENTGSKAGEGASAGAATGTVLGGLAGFLVGAGLLAIPGLGPILAIGPLSAAIGTGAAVAGATAVGAGAGAATGGLIGALVGWGIPEEEAQIYTEGVRRGGILVVVDTDSESQRDKVRGIFKEYGAVDINNRGREYREGGWGGYNPDAPEYPLSPSVGTRSEVGSR